MSHHIYHTRGIILSSSATGESNRFYKIFTEELGLIGAHAQSVRIEKSKLRFVLQDFSVVTLDLVRGKEMWRIVSAGASKPLDDIKKSPAQLTLLARYFTFLARLLQGEGRDQELFDEILRVVDFLEKSVVSNSLTPAFEGLTTLRVLVHLGYMDPFDYEIFLDSSDYKTATLTEFEKIRPRALLKIVSAMNASHL